PPVPVVAAAPALSPCAAARAQVIEGKQHHHHHHGADAAAYVPAAVAAAAPIRKDCGFPWWVIALLALGLVILGVWMWLKRKREIDAVTGGGNGGTVIVRPQVIVPPSPVQSPGYFPASPIPRPASPVMIPQSPVYSPITIQAPAQQQQPQQQQQQQQGVDQVARSYGMVPVGAVSQVTGDQVKADIAAGAPALVMYTSQDCGFCEQTLPELHKAAANLGVPVFIVDRNDLAPEDRPFGYPSIFAIAGPNDARIFGGHRTADAFVRFVNDVLGNGYVRPGCL
ncbi:MAG TPA: protein disulfide isomerase family protein, partial [Rariglobus sp.]